MPSHPGRHLPPLGADQHRVIPLHPSRGQRRRVGKPHRVLGQKPAVAHESAGNDPHAQNTTDWCETHCRKLGNLERELRLCAVNKHGLTGKSVAAKEFNSPCIGCYSLTKSSKPAARTAGQHSGRPIAVRKNATGLVEAAGLPA